MEMDINNLLDIEDLELRKMNELVHKYLKEEKNLSQKLLNAEKDRNVTFGQKLADKIAAYGGSWRFIITFGVFILIWVLINTIFLFTKPFDPYPFILLNLFLSCLAALQAPVIMMSQNRKEEKDRRRERSDILINMKAELEVRNLHEKMDMMMAEQMKVLFDLQKKQIQMMEEILKSLKEK